MQFHIESDTKYNIQYSCFVEQYGNKGESPCRLFTHQILVWIRQTHPNVEGIWLGRVHTCQLATSIFSNPNSPTNLLAWLQRMEF